jgi:hypothetical protein
MATPMSATAATFTALVSTNNTTERSTIRSALTPRLRSTHAPSARPARPLEETTELAASSDSDRRQLMCRSSLSNTSANSTT